MKKIIISAIILIFSIASTHAQISKATITASGLTCSMCSKAIYESLIKVPFVENVKANIKESSYNISFKKDARVNLDALQKAVENAGFSVAKMKVQAQFNNTKVKNDLMLNLDGQNIHFLDITPQTLNGDQQLTIVDKHFISDKEHKKFGEYTSMKCFKTGKLEACCSQDKNAGQRIYHVTI